MIEFSHVFLWGWAVGELWEKSGLGTSEAVDSFCWARVAVPNSHGPIVQISAGAQQEAVPALVGLGCRVFGSRVQKRTHFAGIAELAWAYFPEPRRCVKTILHPALVCLAACES